MVCVKKYIAVVLLGFVLCSGCSVPVHVYISNASSAPMSVFLTLYSNSSEALLFHYGAFVKEPAFNSARAFGNTVTSVEVKSGVYEVVIPAKSTVFVGQTMNFRSLHYRSIIVGGVEIINAEGYYKRVYKTKREGLNKYVIWFSPSL